MSVGRRRGVGRWSRTSVKSSFKLVNCNQNLGQVVYQNYIAIPESFCSVKDAPRDFMYIFEPINFVFKMY